MSELNCIKRLIKVRLECILKRKLQMARLPRIVVPGYPHHVINRGNRRQTVFFSDEDKRYFYELLKRETAKAKISIWIYCLMDNHVHLIAVPEKEDALAKGIGEAQRKYALTINTRNDWKGHLWQSRFDSYPMDEIYLYFAARYIERNPVKAGLVENAEDYHWSSARAHVFGAKDELLTDFDLTLSIADWASYLKEGTSESDASLFQSHAKSGRPLGDDKFLDELEAKTGRSLRKKKKGRRKKL
jgi:putative transposase